MTIHSISIEPCSLSISRRHINWPLFFLVISFRWSFPIFIYIYQRTTVYVRIARVLYQPMCDTHHPKFFQKPPPCHCFRWLCVCVRMYVDLRVICADVKILSAVKPFHFKLLLAYTQCATYINKAQLGNCRSHWFDLSLSDVKGRGNESICTHRHNNLYAPNESYNIMRWKESKRERV